MLDRPGMGCDGVGWGEVHASCVFFLLYLYECMCSVCVLRGGGWGGGREGDKVGGGGGMGKRRGVHRCVSQQFIVYRCVSL